MFLNTLVGDEVANLPRGIFYTSLRKPGASASKNKLLSDVPSLIQNMYDTTKQPGLRPSLAGTCTYKYSEKVFFCLIA